MLAPAPARAGAPLSPHHKKWLEEEVVYIISEEEKKTFLSLPGDDERDKFIQRFWDIRDPTPGTPENEYKDTHYSRIEFANQYFSGEWGNSGWRTDRGKIWIILGKPASRAYFTSGGQVYPIELWFYTTDEPALPPFFYVMFYQRYGASDYRLYSPYVDGPDKLVRSSGLENNRQGAFRFLNQMNPELARASLSLIPSEPVDVETPSLTSDGMLMKILNLSNDKFHKERLERQGRLQEEVKVRMTFDVPALELVAVPLRDPSGEAFIHYALQIPQPQNYAMGRSKDKAYLAMDVQARVLGPNKKLIYEVNREAVTYFSEKEIEDVRTRPLSFEDWLPVVPGDYELEFTLLNRVNRVYYHATTTLHVAALPSATLVLGAPILVSYCEAAQGTYQPFTFGESRCHPQSWSELPTGARANLNLLYPVYLDSPGVAGPPEQPLRVEYTLGRMDRAVSNQVITDNLDRRRFDRLGTLLVGKSLPLTELPPGNYRLATRVLDPVTGHSAASTFSFKLGVPPLPNPNVLVSSELAKDETSGNNDIWRGLCARAQNDADRAATYLARAIERNPAHPSARAQLASLYFSQGHYEQVVQLLEAEGITSSTDRATAGLLLDSLEKTGRLQRAIETAQQVAAVLGPTADLYEQLASLYDRAGQPAQAQQARDQAHRLTSQTNQGKPVEK